MKRYVALAAVCFAVPAAAATALYVPMRIVYPAHEWGVADDEPMMVQVIDGRASFRRPGDEDCLAKYADGPVPCDEVDTFELLEPLDPVAVAPVLPPVHLAAVPPAPILAPFDPVGGFCCRYHEPPVKPPPALPPVPLPGAVWLLALAILALRMVWSFRRG